MSHTGTTKETVRAAEFARAAGATVASITQLPESPLAKAGDVAFAYESDDTVTDAKHLLIGQLGVALRTVGDYPDYAGAMRTLDALPAMPQRRSNPRTEAAIAAFST
jgi:fructoselysine-6-P-deglycase FrlB-like protein